MQARFQRHTSGRRTSEASLPAGGELLPSLNCLSAPRASLNRLGATRHDTTHRFRTAPTRPQAFPSGRASRPDGRTAFGRHQSNSDHVAVRPQAQRRRDAEDGATGGGKSRS